MLTKQKIKIEDLFDQLINCTSLIGMTGYTQKLSGVDREIRAHLKEHPDSFLLLDKKVLSFSFLEKEYPEEIRIDFNKKTYTLVKNKQVTFSIGDTHQYTETLAGIPIFASYLVHNDETVDMFMKEILSKFLPSK